MLLDFQPYILANLRRSRIPGSDEQLITLGRLDNGVGDGVFAAAGTDDEDIHARTVLMSAKVREDAGNSSGEAEFWWTRTEIQRSKCYLSFKSLPL